MAEELGERTEAPTGRRRREARNRGQIARSTDLGSAVDLIGAFLALSIMGGGIVTGLAALTAHLLDSSQSGAGIRLAEIDTSLRSTASRTAMIAGPFLLVMFAIAYLAQFAQVGWLFTLQPIHPKLDRLDPMKGIGRLFSRRNIIKSLVGILKLAILGVIAWTVASGHTAELASLPRLAAMAAIIVLGRMIVDLCIWMLAAMLILGIIDYVYQRIQHTKDLKMTKQEVKEEMRSMEGDLETKGRRLRMAREIAMQRLRQAVPTADVVVTNPTHFAVALKYDGDKMAAPMVVAKGADFLAFRIRELAAANDIPIVERPPLARALYHNIDVGRTIPAEHFEAVAEILAYVYRLQGREPVAA